MNTILILEDNILQLNSLASIIEDCLEQVSVLKAPDYNTAKAYLTQYQIQFFLLDIKLEINNPKARSGIDFGKYIRTLPEYEFSPILFITSVPGQMQTAINQIHCQNYILKPYTTEELLEAIHFLLKTPYLKPTPLKLCDTNGVYYKVSEEDLLYIEAAGKELRFHLLVSEHNRISQLCTNKYRLTELRQILSNHFLQCHKKYIVNLDHITAYDKASSSILLDAFPLPVGRKYKQELEQKILSG